MFNAIFKTQWKWTRQVVLVAVLLAFALPLMSVNSTFGYRTPREVIANMQTWGAAYAALASAVGLVVAWLAWASDHRGHHVYALTLPVARWKYVLMRFGAGVLFLVPVTVALALGALVATHGAGAVPQGLKAYPFALTFRFGFAALVAFAIFFAISAATARTAGYILAGVCLILVAEFVSDALGFQLHLAAHTVSVLMVYPGILSVFSGRWTLIDV